MTGGGAGQGGDEGDEGIVARYAGSDTAGGLGGVVDGAVGRDLVAAGVGVDAVEGDERAGKGRVHQRDGGG